MKTKRKSIVINDSLSSQKKEILLEKNQVINLYLCGPTVYNEVHIGNLRSVIFFDIIIRILRQKKIDYRYIQNITDIDDKIIKRSILEGKRERLLTRNYIQKYKKTLGQLNVITPEFHLVTDNIENIVVFIKRLITNKNAYVEKDNVLFKIYGEKFKEYGKLSKQLIGNLSRKKGRIISEQWKQNQEDFILWKKTETGTSWKTEWSTGRPGWHSECATIIDKNFAGKTIDIHGGGRDLLFPHHENERIQYIAANHCELSRVWIHFGFILSKNTKMSKSKGNYFTAGEFIKKHNGNVLRMLLLESRYSEDIEINEQVIEQAASRIRKIENIIKKISLFFNSNKIPKKRIIYNRKEEILSVLSNNLETTRVINILEENLNLINKDIDRSKEPAELKVVINDFLFGLQIMGFDFQVKKYDTRTKMILRNWKKLLVEGKYEKADHLRRILQKEGVV